MGRPPPGFLKIKTSESAPNQNKSNLLRHICLTHRRSSTLVSIVWAISLDMTPHFKIVSRVEGRQTLCILLMKRFGSLASMPMKQSGNKWGIYWYFEEECSSNQMGLQQERKQERIIFASNVLCGMFSFQEICTGPVLGVSQCSSAGGVAAFAFLITRPPLAGGFPTLLDAKSSPGKLTEMPQYPRCHSFLSKTSYSALSAFCPHHQEGRVGVSCCFFPDHFRFFLVWDMCHVDVHNFRTDQNQVFIFTFF